MICYKNINEGYLLSPQEPLSPLNTPWPGPWHTDSHWDNTEPGDGLAEVNMLRVVSEMNIYICSVVNIEFVRSHDRCPGAWSELAAAVCLSSDSHLSSISASFSPDYSARPGPDKAVTAARCEMTEGGSRLLFLLLSSSTMSWQRSETSPVTFCVPGIAGES